MNKWSMVKSNSVVERFFDSFDVLKDEVYLTIKREVGSLDYFSIVVYTKKSVYEYFNLNDFLAVFKYSNECDVNGMVIDVRTKINKDDLNEEHIRLYSINLSLTSNNRIL